MTCIKCKGLMLIHYDEYICSSCGNVKHKRHYFRGTSMRRQIEETKNRKEADQKRLQSNMKRRHKRFYTRREEIKDLVKQYGVNGTARMLDMPRSSVGLLAKGVQPRKWNRGKFGKEFKLEVALYAIRNKNNYYTAKKFKVSRGSVQNWVREYKRHEGVEWGL